MTFLDGLKCRDCGVFFTVPELHFAWLCPKCRPPAVEPKEVKMTYGNFTVHTGIVNELRAGLGLGPIEKAKP